MTTHAITPKNARCTECRYYHGRHGWCARAGKVAGGRWPRTCAAFERPPFYVSHAFVIRANPKPLKVYDGKQWHAIPRPTWCGELSLNSH